MKRKTQDCMIHHTYHQKCEPGFVYVAHNEGIYKIGCAKRFGSARHVYTSWGDFAGVYGRLQALRRKTGSLFDLVTMLYTQGCVRSLEKFVHEALTEKRIATDELFALSHVDIGFLMAIETFRGLPVYHYNQDLLQVKGAA